MRAFLFAAALACTLVVVAPAGTATGLLRAAPPQVHFGVREVNTENLKGTTITNTSDHDVLLLVTGYSMPDEFGFGLMPGSTCPALGAEILAAGASCDAVMNFRPEEFWVGQERNAALLATAYDPATGEVVDELIIEFTGRGRL